MNLQGQLGAATTRWSDYVGTAAADDAAAVAGHASVYELAGLDRNRWLVVAVDIEVLNGELGGRDLRSRPVRRRRRSGLLRR